LAVGSTGTSARRREALLVEAVQHQSVPRFLKPALEACLLLEGVNVQLLTGDFEHGCTVPILLLLDDDGVIDVGLLIEEGRS